MKMESPRMLALTPMKPIRNVSQNLDFTPEMIFTNALKKPE